MTKKHIFLFFACCIGLIAIGIAVNFENYEKLRDAAVSAESGDITLGYYDNALNCFVVKSYDEEGTFLFRKNFRVGRGALTLDYEGELLLVYLSTDGVYIFDRTGKDLSATLSPEMKNEWEEKMRYQHSWDGWNNRNNSLYLEQGGKEYVYIQSSFGKRLIGKGGCRLEIRDAEGRESVLYKSGVAKGS